MKHELFNEAMNMLDPELVAEHISKRKELEANKTAKKTFRLRRIAAAAAAAAAVTVGAAGAILSANRAPEPPAVSEDSPATASGNSGENASAGDSGESDPDDPDTSKSISKYVDDNAYTAYIYSERLFEDMETIQLNASSPGDLFAREDYFSELLLDDLQKDGENYWFTQISSVLALKISYLPEEKYSVLLMFPKERNISINENETEKIGYTEVGVKEFANWVSSLCGETVDLREVEMHFVNDDNDMFIDLIESNMCYWSTLTEEQVKLFAENDHRIGIYYVSSGVWTGKSIKDTDLFKACSGANEYSEEIAIIQKALKNPTADSLAWLGSKIELFGDGLFATKEGIAYR